MKLDIIEPLQADAQPRPWWRRLAWFAAIWCGSVAALTMVAYAIRWVLKP